MGVRGQEGTPSHERTCPSASPRLRAALRRTRLLLGLTGGTLEFLSSSRLPSRVPAILPLETQSFRTANTQPMRGRKMQAAVSGPSRHTLPAGCFLLQQLPDVGCRDVNNWGALFGPGARPWRTKYCGRAWCVWLKYLNYTLGPFTHFQTSVFISDRPGTRSSSAVGPGSPR